MRLPLNYPLRMSFKIVTFVPQFTIHDSSGQLVAYVRQKLFKLKEAVTVFADEAQSRPLYTLKADRILDFSARYDIADATTGQAVGAVKRQGMKSLWKVHYDVFDANGQPSHVIRGENGWVSFLDSLIGELPIIGLFSGHLLHPAYLVSRPGSDPLLRLVKRPAFFEGRFDLEKRGSLEPEDEKRVLLALVMMLLLERDRG